MSPDTVVASAHGLTDVELRELIEFYSGMARDGSVPAPMRGWYAELARGLAAVSSFRVLVWVDFVNGSGFPGWDVCVSTLPPESG